jgi:DNA-binding IclR family transcriptional regulator
MPAEAAASAPRGGADMVKKAVPAVTRAAAILRLLAAAKEPLGLNQIAREVGILSSTCLHILRALVVEDLIAFDRTTKRYTLDVGMLALAKGALRRNRFSEIVQPALDRISGKYETTAIGVQISGAADHIVVVALAQSNQFLHLNADVGSRFPALISATGRCLAAFSPTPLPEMEREFATLRWFKAPSWKEWQQQVQVTRTKGYAVDDANYIAGVIVIAAPVFGIDREFRHALVTVGMSEQIHAIGVDTVGEDLKRAAQDVSRQLGADAA